MHVQFADPLFLLVAVPLFTHVLWMTRRLHLLSRSRRIVASGLRLLILALLVMALAGMRLTHESKDLTVFFVLDGSDSVPEAQRAYARTFIRKNLGEMGPYDRSGMVVFGANAAVEQGPSTQTEFERPQSVVNSKGTNIASAMELAMACFVGETQKRIVLLSDGNQNAGDAESAARSVAASHVALDVVPLKYENRNDVILEKAIVENRVSLQEPFDLKVIASARQPGPGKLVIHQDGKLMGSFEVQLEADKKNVFVIPTQVRDSGFHTFELQLDAEGDSIPENNRGFAFTFGEGEPRVLLVDGDSPPSRGLASMLLAEKINVETTDPSGLPQTLRDLQNYDALIFNNVAASEISPNQMKLIESAVHDLGLGFIMIGGENSFGPGGYNDSPIERILPVNMELKNEKIMPQGALVPIVHTVEIPEGQHWAEQIVHSALDVLSPHDLMGVLYYSWNGGESWLFPLQEVGNKVHLHNLIKTIQPGDMPSFDTTLQMAYDALVKCNASVKHIIVISDGDPQTPNQALATKIKGAHISISTVCINPHGQRDVDSLKALAKWGGGNFYNPTQYDKLPQIFIKEAATVRKSLIFEEAFTPVVKQYSPIQVGIGNAYPILKGYVGTTAKGLADVPLVTKNSDPLFAYWQHGVGKTIAFTSDAKERWANDWLSWEKYSKFWAQTVRWCLRSPFNQNYQVQTNVDGTKGTITIDAVDANGQFRNFLDIKGRVIAPSLEGQEVTFRQTSPGRYEAHFDAIEPGTYMFSAQSKAEKGEGNDLVTGGTSLSYSPEFQNARSNEALLYRLADIAKGRILDEKSPIFLHNLPSRSEPQPLWPVLLMTALFLFLADVFTRRVIIGWSEIRGGLAVARQWLVRKYGWRRFGPQAQSATGQLLKVKETVRSAEPSASMDREGFLASLKKVKIEKSPVAEAKKKSEPPTGVASKATPTSAKKGDAGPKSESSSLTEQLLKARAQARKKLNQPNEGDKEL